jgi:hypothetical protein
MKLIGRMYSSETPEWCTPQKIINAMIPIFVGTIDPDPSQNN